MVREISAGGVVVRQTPEGWVVAVIEPQREVAAQGPSRKKGRKPVLALPKGLVDEGEDPKQTAIREVLEETGLVATLVTKLIDIKYVYVRTWSDKERVFKIVSFYLLRYESGSIDEISPEMRTEVKCASWMLLEDVEKKLAYRGEKDAAHRAREYLRVHPEELSLGAK